MPSGRRGKPGGKECQCGLLGCDFEASGAYYRFKKIYAGENWDPARRAPLTEPGVKVKQGDYLLAVNGVPLRTDVNPYALFEDTVGKTVTLLVNDRPIEAGARTVQVRPTGDESGVRYLDWVEGNRRRVEVGPRGGKIVERWRGHCIVIAAGADATAFKMLFIGR